MGIFSKNNSKQLPDIKAPEGSWTKPDFDYESTMDQMGRNSMWIGDRMAGAYFQALRAAGNPKEISKMFLHQASPSFSDTERQLQVIKVWMDA